MSRIIGGTLFGILVPRQSTPVLQTNNEAITLDTPGTSRSNNGRVPKVEGPIQQWNFYISNFYLTYSLNNILLDYCYCLLLLFITREERT